MIHKLFIPQMIEDEIARRRAEAERKIEQVVDDAIRRAVVDHIDYPLRNYGKTKEFAIEIVFGDDANWSVVERVIHRYLHDGWTTATIERERKVVLS